MLRNVGAAFLVAFVLAPILTAGSASANLPDILAGAKNAVPECVTPGRMMVYLKSRNPKLNERYDSIATEYMRQGEKLGVRWDFAFYQMIVETGALSHWRGNRPGDVKPSQNNFAGLGATGKGEPGETFADIETGVRAHLEHLLLYAGRPVENPVATRTRNVKEWGVLTAWQQTFTRPINYADMGTRWAPGTKTYATMLKMVADRFHAEVCNGPDPRPALVHEARAPLTNAPVANTKAPDVAKAPDNEPARPSGVELAQRAIEQAKVEGGSKRFALGAQQPMEPPPAPPPFKILNAPPLEAPSQPAEPPAAKMTAPDAKAVLAPVATPKIAPPEKANTRTALAAPAAKAKAVVETAAPPAANQRCRVWTASYGGQKAMIIRSVVDLVVNFTVLDVNDGSETREAEAFIAAYAKNGKIAGEYTSQAHALDKAFELCPEG